MDGNMNWYKKYIYGGLPAYTLEEFVAKLKIFGVHYSREGKGDHAIFLNTRNNKTHSVPMGPGSRIINPVTMKDILFRLDVPWSIWHNSPKSMKRRDIEKIKNQFMQIQLNQSTEPTEDPVEEKIPDWQKKPWYKKQLIDPMI